MTSFDCTACCAGFRVDFDPSEGEAQGGCVPADLHDGLGGSIARMRGTYHAAPRCCALRGRVGEAVTCVIHDERPGPCREFGAGSPASLRVRRRHGIGGVAGGG